jgi:hypothetical protein
MRRTGRPTCEKIEAKFFTLIVRIAGVENRGSKTGGGNPAGQPTDGVENRGKNFVSVVPSTIEKLENHFSFSKGQNLSLKILRRTKCASLDAVSEIQDEVSGLDL